MKLDKHKVSQSILTKLAKNYLQTGHTVSYDVAAKEIGISKPTLSRVVKGKSFDIDTWLKICVWLGMELTDFIAGMPISYDNKKQNVHLNSSAFHKYLGDTNVNYMPNEHLTTIIGNVDLFWLGINFGKLWEREQPCAGKMLDEAVKVKGEPLPVCLSNQFAKMKEEQVRIAKDGYLTTADSPAQ